MKKYLWLTTLFLTSISFAAQLSPVTTEDDFRCEYYQTKNNKTPIGKAIGVSTIGDEEFLYLGLDGKKTKFKSPNHNFDTNISSWKSGNTTAVFKQLKILYMPDNAGKYLESFTLKTNSNVTIKQNLLRICQD